MEINDVFIQAAEKRSINIIKLLLQDDRVDPTYGSSWAIRSASSNGHTDVVELLLKDGRTDPGAGDNYAIRAASRSGYKDIVELLLKDKKMVDPSDDHNWAIIIASMNGHKDVVELLLKDSRVNPVVGLEYAETQEIEDMITQEINTRRIKELAGV